MGQSIIGYLQKKGYPEIALQFVKDPKTRFDLAIECGNIDAALEMAKSIDKEQYWNKLGAESLRQGNQGILEFVYQKTKKFDKLSFLYLCTGNTKKVKKMIKIAEARSDPMSRFQNAVYAGVVEEQVETLLESGQSALAYLCAKTHGLDQKADAILKDSGLQTPPSLLPDCKLARAPHTILNHADLNWPLLNVGKSVLEGGNGDINSPSGDRRPSAAIAVSQVLDEKDLEDVGNWGDEDLEGLEGLGIGSKKHSTAADPVLEAAGEEGWDIDADLDISDGFSTGPLSPTIQNGKPVAFQPPQPRLSLATKWCQNSNLAVDHIAAGSFESAIQVFIF
jgi:coatomer protein complex subunit alpha (xenin)